MATKATAPKKKPKQLKAHDGLKRDFVWKESDTKKNRKGQKVAICLLPTQFKKPHKFLSVTLFNELGEAISKLKFVYYYEEDGSNRQVWRTEIAMKDLPLKCVLLLKGPKNKEYAIPLDDPRGRID